MSYVNEMEDCGAVYRLQGQPVDPFALMKQEGGNIVRVRIWVKPAWTRYSNYADVLKTIRRAHAAGLQVRGPLPVRAAQLSRGGAAARRS